MTQPILVTLTGDYRTASGEPEVGRITITPAVANRAPSHDIILPVEPRTIDLVDGKIPAGTQLFATDDPSWAVQDWTYTVHLRFGRYEDTFALVVPTAAVSSGLDLADVTPAVPVDPQTSYVDLAAFLAEVDRLDDVDTATATQIAALEQADTDSAAALAAHEVEPLAHSLADTGHVTVLSASNVDGVSLQIASHWGVRDDDTAYWSPDVIVGGEAAVLNIIDGAVQLTRPAA